MSRKPSARDQLGAGAAMLAALSSAPRSDAELLLRHVLHCDRAWLLAHPEILLTDTQAAEYAALLARRAQHEPIQYILGEQEFYGLRFRVTPAVLIPRPETEHLVEAVLARVPHNRDVRIADVGTGSGAIAIALASALPRAQIDALDISEVALEIAQENAQTLGVADRIAFHRSDLLAAVRGTLYDAVVSNPPYIASTETLEPQVQAWEPHGALFAGPDGLDTYRRLLPQALDSLHPGGLLALELGAGQQTALEALFASHPQFEEPAFLPDLQGIPRVALSSVTVELWKYLYADTDVSFASDASPLPSDRAGGDLRTGYFGIRIGKHWPLYAVNLSIRPGFVQWENAYLTSLPLSTATVPAPPDPPTPQLGTITHFAWNTMLAGDYKFTQHFALRAGIEETLVRYRNACLDSSGVGIPFDLDTLVDRHTPCRLSAGRGAPPYITFLSHQDFVNRGSWGIQLGPVFSF
jgi:release factor glutamine methyltransferase